MTPAQVFYISGSHAHRRSGAQSVHGPNAVNGSIDDLLAMSATQRA